MFVALAVVATARAEAPSEEVVVVASRTGSALGVLPSAVSVEDLDPLEPRGPGLSLAEEVVAVPGLLVRDRFDAAQGPRISIRGFGARSAFGIRGITVLLDTIPLTLPDGLAQVDLVDPDLLGRIEVLRGPAGALYGNAAGGVLALHSATGSDRTGEDLAVRYGGGGFGKVVVRAAETVPAGSVVLAGTATTQRGFRDHAEAERWLVHGAADLALGERTSVGLVATVLDAPIAQDPGALTRQELNRDPTAAAPDNLTFDAGEEVTQGQLGARVTTRPTRAETVEVSVYQVDRAFVGRIPFRVNELDRGAFGGTARLSSVHPVFARDVHLTAAVDAGRLRDRRTGYDSDGGRPTGAPTLHQDEEVLAVGGYGQARIDVGRTFYRNAGRSHRVGVELAGAVVLPLELGVAAAWTWIDARFDRYTLAGVDLAGNQVPGVPPHHLGVSATWGTGDGSFLGADVDTLSATWADDTNQHRSPTQAVVSARVGYRGTVGRLRFALRGGVENLFDAVHVDNLRVNASNERYYEPGWPRFFHAGLTVGREPAIGAETW